MPIRGPLHRRRRRARARAKDTPTDGEKRRKRNHGWRAYRAKGTEVVASFICRAPFWSRLFFYYYYFFLSFRARPTRHSNVFHAKNRFLLFVKKKKEGKKKETEAQTIRQHAKGAPVMPMAADDGDNDDQGETATALAIFSRMRSALDRLGP